jgi:hypothetical protein
MLDFRHVVLSLYFRFTALVFLVFENVFMS